MLYRLQVLHGKLTNRHGDSAGVSLEVRGPRFLVGTSSECQLCCQSESVSPLHCELLLADEALSIRDMGTTNGTFVNGERIEDETRLVGGDRLRIGRLEFEVLALPEDKPSEPQRDPMSEFVSEMLGEADAEDRARRMADPLLRQFDVSEVESSGDETEEAPSGTEDVPDKEVPPSKKPPGKLPPPPELVADDSVQAAEETLKKIFERPKK